MTIYDIIDLIFDGNDIEVFDCDKGDTVYCGEPCDLPRKYLNKEIGSIEGGNGKIIINIGE